MKVSLFALVAFCALAVSSATNKECIFRKLHGLSMQWANPGDCSSYFRCSNKNVIREMTCSKGKEFNAKTGKCTSSKRSGCTAVAVTPFEDDVNPCTDATVGSWVAQEGTCRNYYVCSTQGAVAGECDTGSQFDTSQGACIPDDGNKQCWQNFCIDVTTTESIQDPSNCEGYISCLNSVATQESCAAGSYFDLESKSCVVLDKCPWPASDDDCNESCTADEQGNFYANPNNCQSFFVCDNLVKVEISCLEGNYFDETANVCAQDVNNVCVNGCITNDETAASSGKKARLTENEQLQEAEPTIEISAAAEEYDEQDEEDLIEVMPIVEENIKETESEIQTISAESTETEVSTETQVSEDVTAKLPQADSSEESIETAEVVINQTAKPTKSSKRPKRSIDDEYQRYVNDKHNHQSNQPQTVQHMGFEVPQHFMTPLTAAAQSQAQTVEAKPNKSIVYMNKEVKNGRMFRDASEDEDCNACPGDIAEGESVAHPNNCYEFYICSSKELVLQSCGNGNFFNSTSLVCEQDVTNVCWPAECTGEVDISTLCTNVANNVAVVNPNECYGYLLCLNGVGYSQSCASYSYFNSITLECELDLEASCRNPCANTIGISFLAHPDCSRYYMCNNGATFVEECSTGQQFNANGSSICSATVDCPTAQCSDLSNEGLAFQYEADDTKFYLCLNGVGVLASCPTDTFFQSSIGACLPEPSEACLQSTCTKTTDTQRFPPIDSSDESAFCYCLNGDAYLDHCDDGLFVASTEKCVSTAPCDPEICYGVADDVCFKAENRNDSQAFCLCVSGSAVSVTCPNYGYFNSDTNLCQESPMPTPLCGKTICVGQDDHTYLKSAETDEGFCLCMNELPTYMPCEDGWLYNDDLKRCYNPNPPACDELFCYNNAFFTFPATGSSTSFCYCTSDTTVREIHCDDGEIYNDSLKRCQEDVCASVGCELEANADSDLAAPGFDDAFCHCSNGNGTFEFCQDGYLFSSDKAACLSPALLYCDIELCADATLDNPIVTAAENDLFSFCYCWTSTDVSLISCPTGLFFNSTLSICQDPNDLFLSDKCTCPGGYADGDFIAHPSNSQFFFICADKILHEVDCGSGNVFSIEDKICKIATSADDGCTNSTSTMCNGVFANGQFIANPINSQTYYICQDSVLNLNDCGTGNIFNAETSLCVSSSTRMLKKSGRSLPMNVDESAQQEVRTIKKFTNFFKKIGQSIF